MCGFVGCFSTNAPSPSSVQLQKALDAIHHRGPDSSGSRTFKIGVGQLDLGFRRLAILDLNDVSNQPFTSLDSRFDLIYNGEIYNYLELRTELIAKGHKFRTNGDTEVLLTSWIEWGIGSLSKLVGMFSFVVVDRVKSEMFFVRDAFGVKPFYYQCVDSKLTFSSEIESLKRITETKFEVNREVAQEYLISGRYDNSEKTFFRDVFSVKPGHYVKLDLTKTTHEINQKKWWFPPIQDVISLKFEEAAQLLREEFLNSVRLHLRSDVKIATALSGGLDSSAIAGAIRHLDSTSEINTFSYVARSTGFDESKWIVKSNEETRAISHLVEISESEFIADSDDLIKTQGEPFGSTSIYAQYRVYKEAKNYGVKVMLDGQGSDELFAGYFGYPENRMVSMLETRKFNDAYNLFMNWSKLPGRDKGQLLRSTVKVGSPAPLYELSMKARNLFRTPDFLEFYDFKFVSPLLVSEDRTWKGNRLTERLLYEQSRGLLPGLLRHADRNSMKWSIENRVPFLTPSLSRISLGVREDFLLDRKGTTKCLLRAALHGIVSESLINRQDKIGFATPEKKWVEELIKKVPEVLDGSEHLGFVNVAKARKFLMDTNSDSNMKWRTYNLIRWSQLLL
jgi:asparagine synthase (glutamine-hydrolysing)